MASIPFQFIVQTLIQGINQDVSVPDTGVWRPPQWNQPALTAITIPAQPPDPTTGLVQPSSVYVFDAILRAEHAQELRRTEYPVQTGANITFNAYKLPAKLTLEIGMSDAMDNYYPGSWTGNASKSVAAYEALIALQTNRTLVTITTRLATYDNMVCESVQTSDTNATRYGLRAIAVFSEFIRGTASKVNSDVVGYQTMSGQPISARPQDTQSSSVGSVQGAAPSSALTAQHQVTTPTTVVNAGRWSSNTVLGLPEAAQVAPIP